MIRVSDDHSTKGKRYKGSVRIMTRALGLVTNGSEGECGLMITKVSAQTPSTTLLTTRGIVELSK